MLTFNPNASLHEISPAGGRANVEEVTDMTFTFSWTHEERSTASPVSHQDFKNQTAWTTGHAHIPLITCKEEEEDTYTGELVRELKHLTSLQKEDLRARRRSWMQ
ncbi:Uncharacterized protein DAT39_007307, partial [Clarias magur]